MNKRIARALFLTGWICAPTVALGQVLTATTGPTDCSATNATSITSGSITGLQPSAGTTTTYTVQTNALGACGTNAFTDAAVVLSGFKWNTLNATTKMCDLEIDLKGPSYDPVTDTVTFSLILGLNTNGNCGEPEAAKFDVYFEIWRSTSGTSGAYLSANTCSSTTNDICDFSTVVTAVSPPQRYMGAAMTGFRLESGSATGTDINQISAGLTGQSLDPTNPYTDVQLSGTCRLGLWNLAAGASGVQCEVRHAILTAEASEWGQHAGYNHQDTTSGLVAPASNTQMHTLGASGPVLCGLEKFETYFKSTTAVPIWSQWAGYDSLNCGVVSGPSLQPEYLFFLGDRFSSINLNPYFFEHNLRGVQLR